MHRILALLLAGSLAGACHTSNEALPDDSGPPIPWPFVQPTVHSLVLDPAVSLRGIAIPSDDVVWLSGSQGSVFRSLDGGASFLAVGPPQAADLDFRSIAAFDADHAWIASAGPGPASQLYATTDGGVTWTLRLANQHPDGFWDALTFWDTQRGLLVGDPTDGFLTILTTTDGGATWKRTPASALPAPANATTVDDQGAPLELTEYGFAASNQSAYVRPDGRAWIGTGGAAARVWRSADFGATWQAADTPLAAADPAAGVFAVCIPDDRTGVIVGGKYDAPTSGAATAAYSRDGGATWRPARALPAGYRSSVAALPRTRAQAALPEFIAVGTSGVSFARKGGAEWEAMPTAPQGLNAIATAPSGATVIAVGSAGQVTRFVF